jgi:hypothetical protein
MNWDIIGATGEWAGALLVGFTLVYLSLQIRQQNRIGQFAAWESIIDSHNQQLTNLTPESAAAYLKGRNEPSECDDREFMLFQNGLRIYFNNTQKAFRAHKYGFIRQEDWLNIGKTFAAEIHSPGGQIWRQGNEDMAKDFFEAVDALNEEYEAVLDFKQSAQANQE